MSLKSMCRLCLAVDVRMHSIINTPLQEIYEKITDTSLTADMSVVACYICYAHLKRGHGLMTRAKKAEQLLLELSQGGDTVQPGNRTYKLSPNYCTSQIEHISTVDTESVTTAQSFKLEVKCEKEKEDVQDAESDHQLNTECQLTSDSEDDVPLKNISSKKRVEKKRSKVRKREATRRRVEKGFSAEFAKEIILSKEEQLEELKERAKSLNYLNSPLKCDLCYKGFVDTRAYENHKAKHEEKSGPYECGICRMRYESERHLRAHAAASHARRYACRRCHHRAHTANQAREHEKWHSGYTYECKLCGQAFRKPTSYLTHMRKRHATQHVCNICGESFVGRHGLLMHTSKTHRGDKQVENASEPASDRFCAECNVQFVSLDAWRRHILTSVKHTAANDTSLECRVCGLRLSSGAALSAHCKAHERSLRAARKPPGAAAPAAKLSCDQCGSNFVNRSKLQAHVKRIHLGLKYNKNIVCEVCGKKCTSNASLKYHQRTHTGEKPFPCSACPKRFADNNQLRIHTRTHTGERPYCCAACGKRFSQKPALNRHYRVHTGAKPYVCQYCSKTFSQSNSLKLHVRTVHLKMPPTKRNKEETKEVTLQSL